MKPCAGDTDSNKSNDHNEVDNDLDLNDKHMWVFARLGPDLSVGFLGLWMFCVFQIWDSYFYFGEQVRDKIEVVNMHEGVSS